MNEESLLSAAVDLLAVPSTADRPDQLRQALEMVLDMIGTGFSVERFAAAGKPSALVHTGTPRPRFRVLFNAHLDVVPAAPHQFAARRDGDRLYARGAQDMKISALVLATIFRELAGSLAYPIGLQLVTDEEVGGHHGTRYQLDQGVQGRFVVIGEYSGLELVTESKGIAEVTLHAEGRGGHGAYPWLGDNALLKAIRGVDRLMRRYPEPAGEVWRTTVNVARINTGDTATNQIPAAADARLDIRFPPEDTDLYGRTPEQVAAHLRHCCGPGVSVTVHRIDPPHRADRNRPEIAALRGAVRRQGFPAGFLRKHGAADSRFYSRHGIDAVIFGIGGGGQHGPDEYADLTTIGPYYRALHQFLTDLDA